MKNRNRYIRCQKCSCRRCVHRTMWKELLLRRLVIARQAETDVHLALLQQFDETLPGHRNTENNQSQVSSDMSKKKPFII